MAKKLINPKKVVVYYKCCECKTTISMSLTDVSAKAFLCNECDNLENFMQMIGIEILESEEVELKRCSNCNAPYSDIIYPICPFCGIKEKRDVKEW